MKKHTLLLIFSLCFLLSFSQPVISSFAPTAGPVGTTVIINGTGFSSTAAANIVFFGAVKATVTSATTTSLTVQVPTGAGYKPITVTVNGLSAYSGSSFTVTFPGGNDLVAIAGKQSFFEPAIDSTTGLHPNGVAIADFDGDGKPDIATPNDYSILGEPASVSVFRNTGSPRKLSLSTRMDLPTGRFTHSIAAGDLDGDGKPDLVSSSMQDQTISVFRNNSTPGNISFAAKTDYPAQITNTIVIRDIDGDGRPDIIIAGPVLSNVVSVFRNTSTGGILSFAAKTDFFCNTAPMAITVNDLDGDNKPDIAASNQYLNSVSIIRNTSVPGSVSFAAVISMATGSAPSDIASADIDSDGKIDLVTANNTAYSFSILRNTSTSGALSFAIKKDFPTGASATDIALDDINGDGKADVLVACSNMTASQNMSTPGNIVFGSQVYFWQGPTPFALGTGDLDGDGKTDLITAQATGETISLYRNKSNEPTIGSFNPAAGVNGNLVTITGIGFTNATAVSFGGVPASSFAVASATTITATVPLTVSGDVAVTTPYGSATKEGFIYAAPPTIAAATPLTGNYQTVVTITGTNFTGVTSVKFGGTAASSFSVVSPTSITAVAGNGVSGDISVTNAYGTANLAGFTFIPKPQISAFTPAVASPGTTVTITGSNFANAGSVLFGGVAASSFMIVSPTTITAVTSNGATGDVTVVTPGGTATKSGFTILPSITSFSPASAGPGTTVTITGINFTGITMVRFGGFDASSFSVVSPTTITAVVSGGRTGDVTVVTALGSASKPGFTFISAPVINSFTPLHGGTGTVMTITGNNFSNASTVKIGGVAALSFIVASADTITAVVPGTTSGNISVTTPGGTATKTGFMFTTAPVVHSFSPLTAIPGATLTIRGANFSANANDNIVYFGSVKATVQSATPNLLTVTVPYGAIHAPVSVSSNYLTAYSREFFLPGFSNAGAFSASSYIGKISFAAGLKPGPMKAGDIDGDGKTDLVLLTGGSNIVSIYRNKAASGVLKFDRLDLQTGADPNGLALADINGDGKLDIVYTASNREYRPDPTSEAVTIFENTSVPGTVSFKNGQSFTTLFNPTGIAIGDLQGDGKPDIAVADLGQSSVSVFNNRSSNGTIAMSPRRDLSLYNGQNVYVSDVCIADIAGDEIPDIIVGDALTTSFTVFENVDSRTIEYPIAFGGSASSMTPVDFNGDHQVDFLVRDGFIKNISYYNGFGYSMNLATQIKVSQGGIVAIGDLNGDGKPDFARANYGASSISAVLNTSSSGSFFTAPDINFPTGNDPRGIVIVDLDGDGKPEIATANFNEQTISILKDQSAGTVLEICEGSNKTITASAAGSTYQWQENSGSGFSDISNNALFQGVTTNTLSFTNVGASMNGNQYRCVVNGNAGPVSTITINTNTRASVTIATPYNPICSGVNVSFIATVVNGGTSPAYQWQVNGINVGTNSNIFSTSTLATSDKVSAIVTSNAGCVAAPATSNVLTVTVSPAVTPSVTISAPASICAGTTTTFTAVPVNGGSPGYQWQLNNTNVGTNSNTYTPPTLKANDVLKVTMWSNAACANPTMVTSAPLTVVLNPATKPAATITAPTQTCAGSAFTVSFNSSNAPVNSSVQLWESTNGGAYTNINMLPYAGTVLNFQVMATTGGIKNYFFKIIPPSNTCFTPGNTDTVTTSTDDLLKPVTNVVANVINVQNADISATYQWQMKDAAGNWNNIGAATAASYTPVTTGSYRVRADKGKCVQYSEEVTLTVVVTAVNPVTGFPGIILIYPNPTNGLLTIDSLQLNDRWKVLDIVSAETGTIVCSFPILNQTRISLHLEMLSSGTYLAVLRRKDGSSVSLKFVKF